MTTLQSHTQFAVLEGVATQDREAILRRSEAVTIQKGAKVIEAGSPAASLLLVCSGKIELRFNFEYFNGSIEVPLEIVGPGGGVGWSALIPPHNYTLTAYATEDAELLRLPAAALKDYCQAHPSAGHVIMGNIARIIGERYEISRRLLVGEIQRDLKKKEDHSLWKSD